MGRRDTGVVTPHQQRAVWPALPFVEWKDTLDTLHMFTQVVGKVRLALSPAEPEWGQVPLYPTARGLSTSVMPWNDMSLDLEFDLLAHELVLRNSRGRVTRIPLTGRSVARFYREVMDALDVMGVKVAIWPVPVEIPNPIPFEEDERDTYDPSAVERFFDVLTRVARVLHEHRAEFRGRTSPVNFFWGTFDLANARYSGAPATPPEGADVIIRGSYDVEQIVAGFWPGDERFPESAFFAYAYPKPDGVEHASVEPPSAAWNEETGLFVVRYEDVRAADDPTYAIHTFLDSTYTACATLRGWSPALVQRNFA